LRGERRREGEEDERGDEKGEEDEREDEDIEGAGYYTTGTNGAEHKVILTLQSKHER